MSGFDELYQEMLNEEKAENAVSEPVETPSEPSEPEEQPKDEPKPSETPVDDNDEGEDADTPSEEEPKPAETKPEHKEIPDDKIQRAEFSFRRQLGKQKDKYESELKARDDKYETLRKEFEEFKKLHPAPQEKPKTRDDFENDEDYIHYLNEKDFRDNMAKRDAEAAEAAKAKAEEERKKAEEQKELEETQRRWVAHVDEAFGGDKARANKFIERVQYCNAKGLGNILDACPVAADYLMNNPEGPKVFEKILNDRATFERVFNERRMSPLDIYYELRTVEKELKDESAPTPAPVNHSKPIPVLGRPGKQAGAGTTPDIWSDDDAMEEYIRSHR